MDFAHQQIIAREPSSVRETNETKRRVTPGVGLKMFVSIVTRPSSYYHPFSPGKIIGFVGLTASVECTIDATEKKVFEVFAHDQGVLEN